MYVCDTKKLPTGSGEFLNIFSIYIKIKRMVKENELFANSQMQKRKTPEQEDFEYENLDVLGYAVKAINQALEMMHKERELYPFSYRGKNWAATTMNGFVQGIMLDKYPDRMKSFWGSYSYVGVKSLLKFKKLNDKFIPENIKTEKVDRERNQQALLFETNIPIIYIGYTVDKTMDEITGCYAVCLDDWDRLIWVSDLTDISDTSSNGYQIVTDPVVNVPEISLVRLRKTDERKAE